MNEELEKLEGRKVPIRTRSGGKILDHVYEVKDDVVVLATNADGSGRRTVLAISEIESFTFGGAMAASNAGGTRYR